jgi:hypothetical protein
MKLSTGTPFAKLRGALPVLLDRKPSHFECDHWDVKDFVRTYPDVQSGHRSKYALAIRWGQMPMPHPPLIAPRLVMPEQLVVLYSIAKKGP